MSTNMQREGEMDENAYPSPHSMDAARLTMTDLRDIGGDRTLPQQMRMRKKTLVPLSNEDHAFDFDAKSMRLVMGLHDVDSLTGMMEFDEIVHNELNLESPTPSSFRYSLSSQRRHSSTSGSSMTQVLDDWEPDDIYDHPHSVQRAGRSHCTPRTPCAAYNDYDYDQFAAQRLPDGDRESHDGALSDSEFADSESEGVPSRELTPCLVRRISRDEETEMVEELRMLTRKHSESLSRRDVETLHLIEANDSECCCSESESPISALSGAESEPDGVERGHLLREHSADKWDDDSLETQTQEIQRQISRLCSQHLTA